MTYSSAQVLAEARRLYKMGFAVLWLKPKSKAPVESRWTSGARKTWDELKSSFKPGYNLGVRLGTPSIVSGKYLAVIDIDVKSTDPKHRKEAGKCILALFPGLSKNAAQVASGRGNGSAHIYILTDKPASPAKLRVSGETVKVLMPSVEASKAARAALSEEDINEGYRLRPAWEIAVMGEGQQVVLPPSIHPDSGQSYRWVNDVTIKDSLAVLEIEHKGKVLGSRTATQDWQPEEYDLTFSELSTDIIDLILFGECDDRSAALFKVTIAMIAEGLTDRQIMTVLTDQNYVLGQTAYTHAKTTSRARAANWLYNYTIKKARAETDASLQFNEAVVVEKLSPEDSAKQKAELIVPPDWRDRIERNGPTGVNANSPRNTLKNLVLILENEVSTDVFKRDEFAWREFYGRSTPWGGKKGALIGDGDALKIKMWASQRYRFEPKKELVFEAMTYIADRNAFDPVKEWLEALPEWDGLNRLDHWLKNHFEAEGDPEYLAQVFRKWLVAMVMRVYKPGSKFDWMPIFEGKQGIGKSSIGRLLVGEKYFLDWLPDLSNKDSALALQGIWAVEFGELANIRKQDVESAKAFITRTVDKVRPPYGRLQIESPRRCVFFGTTNSDTYLRDDSGNRRFKPVKVGQLDFEAVKRDRDQLFAEALFIFKNGLETEEMLEIDGAAKDYETQIQAEKMVLDDSELMREDLLEFLQKGHEEHEKSGVNFDKFKIKHLFENYAPLAKHDGDSRDTMFAAKALKALGAKKWKSDGTNYWSFKNVKRDTSGIGKILPVPGKNMSKINE